MDHGAIICFMIEPTCASSRCRCSRPERGQHKSTRFSWCRCYILVVDYRWGSIGSERDRYYDFWGPREIDVFYGALGAIGFQIIYFFRM